MKKFLWILIILVVLPTVLTVVLIKFFATPLVNFVIKEKVQAPAKVEKIETNWFLTDLKVYNLEIDQPPDFGKGPMLVVPYTHLNIAPPLGVNICGSLKVQNFYLHYKEKNGRSNIAEAFGIKTPPSNATGEKEFKLKEVQLNSTFCGLENIKYSISGLFEGFYNNAPFWVNGTAKVSLNGNFETLANFKVLNWVLRGKILQMLAGKNEIELTKVTGKVKVDPSWVHFVDENTKAYAVGDILFAEIYKGSKYNYKTKELDIRGVVYLPVKVEFSISGTVDNPKVELKNVDLKLLLPKKDLKQPSKATKEDQIKETIKQTIEQLENSLQNLFK